MKNTQDMPYLLSVASKFTDPERPFLKYVRVDNDRLWASDGHRAVFLRNSSAIEPGDYLNGVSVRNAEEAPPIDQLVPSAETPVILTLGLAEVEKLRNLVSCVNKNTLVLLTAKPDAHVFWISLHYSKGSGRNENKHSTNLTMDGLPSTHMFSINVQYLLDAIDAVACGDPEIRLLQADPLEPIRIDGSNGFAIIMPCRV